VRQTSARTEPDPIDRQTLSDSRVAVDDEECSAVYGIVGGPVGGEPVASTQWRPNDQWPLNRNGDRSGFKRMFGGGAARIRRCEDQAMAKMGGKSAVVLEAELEEHDRAQSRADDSPVRRIRRHASPKQTIGQLLAGVALDQTSATFIGVDLEPDQFVRSCAEVRQMELVEQMRGACRTDACRSDWHLDRDRNG
jgi:hypothetical protein